MAKFKGAALFTNVVLLPAANVELDPESVRLGVSVNV